MGEYGRNLGGTSPDYTEQEALISKARKLFVEDKLKFDDFRVLKKEYQDISGILRREFNIVKSNLWRLDKQLSQPRSSLENIFYVFQYMDNADKKQLVNLMPPGEVDIRTGSVSLKVNRALAKVL